MALKQTLLAASAFCLASASILTTQAQTAQNQPLDLADRNALYPYYQENYVSYSCFSKTVLESDLKGVDTLQNVLMVYRMGNGDYRMGNLPFTKEETMYNYVSLMKKNNNLKVSANDGQGVVVRAFTIKEVEALGLAHTHRRHKILRTIRANQPSDRKPGPEAVKDLIDVMTITQRYRGLKPDF